MGRWFDDFEVKEDHTQWTVQMIQIKILPTEKNNKNFENKVLGRKTFYLRLSKNFKAKWSFDRFQRLQDWLKAGTCKGVR